MNDSGVSDVASTLRKRKRLIIFGSVLAMIILIGAGRWLLYRLTHVTSDAGFVKADIVALSPLVRGNIAEILVDEGSPIEPGQLLARLDDRDYQLALEKAEATLTRARLQYERNLKLHEAKVISNSKFEDIEASYKEAKAARDIAQLNVEHTRIVAPFAGVVAKKHVDPGDFAAPGLPVVSVYDPKTMHVLVNLEESKVRNVKLGAPSDLFFEASSQVLHGKVYLIGEATSAEFALIPRDVSAGEFTRVVQRLPIKISLPDIKQHSFLKPGLSVSIGISKGS